MGSAKDSEEGKSVCAGERQDPDEDITFEDFEFHDEQMTEFWASLNKDRGQKAQIIVVTTSMISSSMIEG